VKANSEPVSLSAPLDQYGAELLKAALLPLLHAQAPSPQGDVTVRLGDADRMHAACLQVLLALQRELHAKGRKVILEGVDPGVRKLFRISGTEDFFSFSDAIH